MNLPLEVLREPGRYHVRCLIVYAGFVQWLVLSGPHADEFITTLATGHPAERRDRETWLDLLPPPVMDASKA